MGIVCLPLVNGCARTHAAFMVVVLSGAGGVISSAADTVRTSVGMLSFSHLFL